MLKLPADLSYTLASEDRGELQVQRVEFGGEYTRDHGPCAYMIHTEIVGPFDPTGDRPGSIKFRPRYWVHRLTASAYMPMGLALVLQGLGR